MHRRVLTASAVAPLLCASALAQLPAYRTYLGGGGNERVQGVTTDALGRVIVTGHTNSANFPSVMPYAAAGWDTSMNGGSLDSYVAILAPDLSSVVAWTLLGGNGEDRAYQVEVDPLGQIVVVGFSDSSNFPRTVGPAPQGGWDVFVTRFSPDLKHLRASSLLGGSADENPRGSFCIDAAGNVFVSGETKSFDFPVTPGAFATAHAPAAPDPDDAFVAKIGADGLVRWATYLGGSLNDAAYSGCRLASDGGVICAGYTNSPDFPATAGAFQPVFGGHGSNSSPYSGDGFVAKFSADGSQLLWATFLGGSETDAVAGNDALELDGAGNVVVIGDTRSPDFPVTPGVFQPSFMGTNTQKPDAFVARLSPDGAQLLACTYFGGELNEEASGLAVLPSGDVVFSGNTHSGNLPVTPDANQPMNAGGVADGFIAKLSSDLRFLVYSSYFGGSGTQAFGDRGRGLVLTAEGDALIGGDTDSSNFPVTPGVFDNSYGGGQTDSFVSIESLSSSYPFGTGKLTSIGTEPKLRKVGSSSATVNNLAIVVSGAVPLRSGFLGYGFHLVEVPYQGGLRYMGMPVMRVPGAVQLDAVGEATAQLQVDPSMVGETRIYQFWFRDPAHPDGTHSGLSNALKVTFTQ
jgi:hypothetical protein